MSEELSSKYLEIVDRDGVNSKQAAEFRELHSQNPEMAEFFASVAELERAGKTARVSRAVAVGGWAGAFVCVLALGLLGIQRGIDLAGTRTLLAETETRLQLAKNDEEQLKTEYAAAERDREKMMAEVASLKNTASGQLVTKLNDATRTLEATKTQLASAAAALKHETVEREKAQAIVADLKTKVEKSEMQVAEATRAAGNLRKQLAAMSVPGESGRVPDEIKPTSGVRVVTSVSFTSDGKSVAVVSDHNLVTICDIQSQKVLHREPFPSVLHVLGVGFVADLSGPNVPRITARARNNEISIWTLDNPESMSPIVGDWRHINSAVFSPDGRRIAFSGTEPYVTFVDAASRQILGKPLKIE